MSKLSLREIAQSQLDSTPVIDGQLIVCLDTGNAYRDTATAHVKIGSDLEVVSDLPLAPLAEKLYYLKPDKLYVFVGGNWTLLNDKTIDLDESIAKLPAGTVTDLNDDVEIITQDTDFTQPHYYRRKLVVLWEYIKVKAQDFFAAKNHKHGKADIIDFPTSMPASDVYAWAKAATKPSYTKAEVGLGKVDNTADADKTVKRAITAGTADSANSVMWENVKDKPTTFPIEAHNHDDRYYTEAEMNSKLNGKVDNTEAGANGLINKLSTADGIPNDATVFISQHNDGKTASYYRRPISTLWTYIKSKADGVYQPKGSYAASSHTHDDRYYTESEVNGKLGSKVDNTEAGANGLLSKLAVWTATPTDDTYFMRQDTGGGNSFGRVKFSTLWNYIKGKADGTYQPKGNYSTTDTKNTAGSTNTTSKLYLIGATSQSASPQTYSNASVYTTGGVLAADGIGKDGYIAYPGGGFFTTQNSVVTGYCKIVLPVGYTNTMMSFTVTIYDYVSNESVDYRVSGYNYNGNKSWYNPTAVCVGKAGAAHSNLTVRFGDSGSSVAITIGESTTRWDYPQVTVHDVLLGFGDYGFNGFKSGWSIVFDKQDLSNVSQTISNTHVGYDAVTSWDKIQSKPSSFTPASHNHDDRYYTESEMNTKLNEKLSLSGGTMTGPIKFNSSSLPSRTGQDYIVGIDSFGNGGTLKWSEAKNVKVGSATTADHALVLSGFSSKSNQTWGVQTGTFVHGEHDGDGGDFAFRKNCPANGQLSMVLDGRFYQNEGKYRVLDTSDEPNLNVNSANFAKETYINQYKTVNLTDLDQNTWYPVTGTYIPYKGLRRFKCNVQLNSGSRPNWSTHSGGFTAVVDILEESSGWGTTTMRGMVLVNDQYWINDSNKPPVGYSQLGNSSIAVWWLRGGGTYFLAADYDCTWTIQKSKYESNSQSVSPMTTYPGVSVNRSDIVANLNGHASTAEIATTGVRDYNNASNTIRIGWSGADLDKNTLAYIAGYTSDMKIHTASKDGVRSWLGLGNAAYKNIRSLSNVGSSGWVSQTTDDGYVPTMSFMAFWNGAYNSNGASNLQYCGRGRFGTIVTKSSGDYLSVRGGTMNGALNFANNTWNIVGDDVQIGDHDTAGSFYIQGRNGATNIKLKKDGDTSAGSGDSATITYDGGNLIIDKTIQANLSGNATTATKANSADYLNFTHGNEINFTGTPSNNTVYFGYRNSTINEYVFCKSGETRATVTASAFNGKATSAGTADSATTSNGVKDYNDANRTIKIGYAGSGLNTSNLTHIAGYTENGTKIKDVSKDVLTSWIGLGNYLPLSGGTMSGQITKSTGGSWIGDRDRAAIKSSYAGDSSYGAVAAMATKNGYWTMGNLGGNESLIFNYSTDTNYSAGKNETSQVCLPAQAGTIITSATIGSQTVNRAEYLANDSAYMRMHWSGQNGQPSWLWGGNDSSNMYVYNPSNFSVNYAATAGNGVATSGTDYIRFGDGTQICWGNTNSINNSGTSSHTFPAAFSDTPCIALVSTSNLDDVWYVKSRSTTAVSFGKAGWLSGKACYIAAGRWK